MGAARVHTRSPAGAWCGSWSRLRIGGRLTALELGQGRSNSGRRVVTFIKMRRPSPGKRLKIIGALLDVSAHAQPAPTFAPGVANKKTLHLEGFLN
jgi:hypothetical protein